MIIEAGLSTYFVEDLNQIKEMIKINLSDNSKKIKSIIDTMAAADGKLIRATMVLIGGSFGCIDRKRLRKLASAVELLHLASLVHDDIIDESEIRRGKATLHSNFGIKTGIYAGDYIFSQALILFSLNSSLSTLINVSETMKFICRGEIEQFLSRFSFEVSVKNYLRRIHAKSASLFSLSLLTGANESGADKNTAHLLKSIGYYTGMAFQLIDDLLDLTMPPDFLGKPSGNDMKQGIYTLPVIYELKNGNEHLKTLLRMGEFNTALALLKESPGAEKSRNAAKWYTEKSLGAIQLLPEKVEKYYLKDLVERLLTRTF